MPSRWSKTAQGEGYSGAVLEPERGAKENSKSSRKDGKTPKVKEYHCKSTKLHVEDSTSTSHGVPAGVKPYTGRIHGSLHGERLCSGGVALLADVQHADAGLNPRAKLADQPETGRLYSLTLDSFRQASRYARQLGAASLVLLGDQVDDRDHFGDAAATTLLNCADEAFSRCAVGYVLGNHDTKWTQTFREARARAPVLELREHFAWECGLQSEDGSCPWLLIALDCYAISFAKNPEWGQQLSSNGEVGTAQREWLRERLHIAERNRQHVVILSHVSLNPNNDASDPHQTVVHTGKYAGRRRDKTHTVADSDLVLQVLEETQCVKLCISGHDHPGAFHVDEAGIHFVTLPACLSAGLDLSGAVLKVFRDRAVLTMLRCGSERVICYPAWHDKREFSESDGETAGVEANGDVIEAITSGEQVEIQEAREASPTVELAPRSTAGVYRVLEGSPRAALA